MGNSIHEQLNFSVTLTVYQENECIIWKLAFSRSIFMFKRKGLGFQIFNVRMAEFFKDPFYVTARLHLILRRHVGSVIYNFWTAASVLWLCIYFYGKNLFVVLRATNQRATWNKWSRKSELRTVRREISTTARQIRTTKSW